STATPSVTPTAVVQNNSPILNLDTDNSGGNSPDFATAFVEDAGALVIVDDVTITDDTTPTITSAAITITNLLDGDDEQLLVSTGTTGISAIYSNGVLTLLGRYPLATYEVVLGTIQYENRSDDPSTEDRLITFVVSDGSLLSSEVTSTVSIISTNDSPVVDLDADNSGGDSPNADAGTYDMPREPIALIDDAVIYDSDDSDLELLQITLVGMPDGPAEVLQVDLGTSGLTSTYVNGVLTITGTAPAETYLSVLNTLTYTNETYLPASGQRMMEVVIGDGDSFSQSAIITLGIADVSTLPNWPGWTCLSWLDNQPQDWVDVSDTPTVFWDTFGMYNQGYDPLATVAYALPDSGPWQMLFVENGRVPYTVFSGEALSDLTTELARQPDDTYFVRDGFVVLQWNETATTVDDSQIFTYFCYSAQPYVDLEPTTLDTSNLMTDLDTLAVSGSIGLDVTNSGSADINNDFDIIFYEDLNGNQTYEAKSDLLLSTVTQSGLAAGETVTIDAPAGGRMRFAGDLVHAFVDSQNVIIEADETNNILYAQCSLPE
ncbi:MAG: hypothetical protein KC546_11495, partial [Anaerolineae bacterium]|nr:hypothetical protein [Anaerolineae bacterium]